MKQKLIWIISIVAILILFDLGGKYYVGRQSERAYRRSVDLINDTPGVQAKVVSYVPGFFKSSASTTVHLANENYTTNDIILPGPIVFDKRFPFIHFCLAKVISQISPSPFNVPIIAEWQFPYFGGMTLYSESKAFEYQEPNAVLTGSGWVAKGKIDRRFETYTFENSIPLMTIRNKSMGEEAGTELKDAKVYVAYHKKSGEEDLKITYDIAEIATLDKKAQFGKLGFQGELYLKPDTFDTVLKFKINEALFQKKQIGPLSLHLKVENIDRVLFNLFLKKANPTVQQMDLTEITARVLKRGVTLSVGEWQATLPEGQFDMRTHFTVGGPEIKEPINADGILLTLMGDLYFSLPKASFRSLVENHVFSKLTKDPDFSKSSELDKKAKVQEETTRLIDVLKQSGVLVETEKNVILKFSFSKGRWLVNGQEIPKPSL